MRVPCVASIPADGSTQMVAEAITGNIGKIIEVIFAKALTLLSAQRRNVLDGQDNCLKLGAADYMPLYAGGAQGKWMLQ